MNSSVTVHFKHDYCLREGEKKKQEIADLGLQKSFFKNCRQVGIIEKSPMFNL